MKYLVALMWPAGIGMILATGRLLARRYPDNAERGILESTAGANGSAGASPSARSGRSRMPSVRLPGPEWVADTATMLGVILAGVALVFGVMAVLGLLVVYHGRPIDAPIYHWTLTHQLHLWASVQSRLTKIGNTWTCWAAAATAAVCLAVTWRSKRWLPPVVLATAIVVDKLATMALRHTFHRPGPPLHPFGTYPSGGADRAIFFYGLIAYVLWREFSGRRATAIWAAAVVACLGFNEAYSRAYLTMHWFTDVLSGLFYGGLLLAVFITAVGLVAGPVSVARGDGVLDGGRAPRAANFGSRHPIDERERRDDDLERSR